MTFFVFLFLPLLIACQDTPVPRSGLADATTPNVGYGLNNPPIVSKNNLHPRCQSETRCFYSRMPIYKQDHFGLAAYIGDKIGESNYGAPGLCAPTAAAMVIKGSLSEMDKGTKLNHWFLQKVPSINWFEIVYQIGVDSGTDFIKGGTFTHQTYAAFEAYFQKTQAKKSLSLSFENSWPQKTYISNHSLINSIKAKKPALWIAVDALVKRVSKNKTWYELQGPGHALVIKGFDGDRLHIQDPWGMDHFARIEQESFPESENGKAQIRAVFTNINSTNSYMGQNSAAHKVVLDEVISLSLD